MAYKDIDDKIILAAQTTSSASQAASQLGMRYSTYKRHAERLGVFKTNQAGKGIDKSKKVTVDFSAVLRGERPYTQTGSVKGYLLKEGIKTNECELCGVSEWMGEALMCHLDHINGVNNDHRLENLRMVCPNCHSQTHSYCGRNKAEVVK